jgi:hypothetical protein
MKTTHDWDRAFREDLDADAAVERRLLLKELAIIALTAALVMLRQALL